MKAAKHRRPDATPRQRPCVVLGSRLRSPALLLLGSLAVPATAQNQPTLDELLDLAPPAAEPGGATDVPESPAPAPSADVTLTEGVEDRLTGEQVADAFVQAVRDMDRVAARLDDNQDPGLDTQRLQESIIARLDQLIEAAQQQQQSSSSSSSSGSSGQASNQDSAAQNAGQQPGPPQPGQGDSPGPTPGQPAQANGENPGGFSPGQVGPVDPGQGAIDEVRSEWGALPPRLRDELTNGLDEPYSPVYRNLTEAYYRRLAQEANQ